MGKESNSRKMKLRTDGKDILKIGAYLEIQGVFDEHASLYYYWLFLAIMATSIQFLYLLSIFFQGGGYKRDFKIDQTLSK